MGLLCVCAVYEQPNANCSLEMRLHTSPVIFEYEGPHAGFLKHLLSHPGINLIVERLQNNHFF